VLSGYGLRRAPDLQAPTTRIVDLLDGGEALMATWQADARRLSRRCEREGVEVTIDRSGDRDALATFHDLLEAIPVIEDQYVSRLLTRRRPASAPVRPG